MRAGARERKREHERERDGERVRVRERGRESRIDRGGESGRETAGVR